MIEQNLPKEIKIAISEVADGNMSYMFGDKDVAKNRKNFLAKHNISLDSCVGAYLKHTNKVAVADPKLAGISVIDYAKSPKVDGLITDQKNLYLLMTFGDCFPITFYDPVKKVVGLIHAGWRGTDSEIVVNAVGKLKDRYGCDPTDIEVTIGPGIRKESYVFDKPFDQAKPDASNPRWGRFVTNTKSGGCAIDLVGFNKLQLVDSGVRESKIGDYGIDTAKDKNYFSHYRDKENRVSDQGRFMVVVGLV